MEDNKMVEGNESENHLAKFLTDTKQIIDVMDEFKSELSELQNSLQKHENTYGKLQNQLGVLNENRNQDLLTLEINARNKEFVQEFYNNYLNLAQTIYSSYSELHKEVHLLKNNWDHVQEVTNEVEENMSRKKDILKTKEKELHAKLEDIKNRKTEIENEQILDEKENQELLMTVQKLNGEIEEINSCISLKELQLIEQNTMLSNKTSDLREIMEITATLDEQLLKTAELFDKMNSENPTETNNSIKDLDKQISLLESEISEKESLLQGLQDSNISLKNEISTTEHNIQEKELKKESISQELNKINVQIIEMEQNTAEKVKCCDEAAKEAKQKLLKMKEYREQLLEDLTSIQETHREECEELEKCISKIPENNIPDLNKKIENIESEYKDIEISLQVKEKQYQDNLNDIEEKIEQAKLESLEYKFHFQKQKQCVAETESLLSHFQLEYKAAKEEIEKNRKTADELKEKINKLKTQKMENTKRQQLNESARKRVRNWDSDSSMEGGDLNKSDFNKARLEIRKLLQDNKRKEK